MAWSKIKTIIIVILLLLNAFLLVLIGSRQAASRRYEATALSQTVQVLSDNGIAVDESVLPRSMELGALAVTRDEVAEAAAARRLLGEDAVLSSTAGLNMYTAGSGSVSFRGSGDFSAALQLSAEGYASPADHAAALMGELGAGVWSISAEGETVTVVQTVNGAPAFNVRLTLVYEGSVLTSMEGKLLLGAAAADAEQGAAITVPTALVSFLGYIVDSGAVCRSIQGMTAGYLTAAALTDPVRLTPTWLVETDTASYYVDASTGNVTRVS